MSNKSDSRIYIGNLPPDVRTKDIEDLFYKYGKIRYIDLKNRKGPPFAFVEFEDALDAEDAIKGRDNYEYEGYRLRVEFQKGARGGRGAGGGSGAGYSRGGGGGGVNQPPRRSENRVIITGLPPTGSWQDLKDHMRVAGNVCYADVFKDGTGVVEFIRYDDAKYAVKNLDDTKFRSHEVREFFFSIYYIFLHIYISSLASVVGSIPLDILHIRHSIYLTGRILLNLPETPAFGDASICDFSDRFLYVRYSYQG